MIRDFTEKELAEVPENDTPSGSGSQNTSERGTNLEAPSRSQEETHPDGVEHRNVEKLFPPPAYHAVREHVTRIYCLAIMIGLGSVLSVSLLVATVSNVFVLAGVDSKPKLACTMALVSSMLLGLGLGGSIIWLLQGWLKLRIQGIWDDELWAAAKRQEKEESSSEISESTQWLNSILSSVWSLVNPDLFTSLADTLEDVMQASLPKFVRMISVEDLGQGSESLRILGIRWLPNGAAAKNMSEDGKISSGAKDSQNPQQDVSSPEDDGNGGKGMKAEEGDFVNVSPLVSILGDNPGATRFTVFSKAIDGSLILLPNLLLKEALFPGLCLMGWLNPEI